MADRRSFREKALEATRSAAGTLGEGAKQVASTTAEGARQAVSDVQEARQERQARKELESFREDEVTDQAEARLERRQIEAREQARQEAREEFRDEYEEELLEEYREEEKQRLRSEYGMESNHVEEGARGLQERGASQSFFDRATSYESGTERETSDENESAEAAASVLYGMGFGGPGDGSFLVGVDEDKDGQIEADETIAIPPVGLGMQGRERDGREDSNAPELRFLGGGQDAGPFSWM